MKQLTLTTIPLLCAAVAPLCADNMGTKKTGTQQTQQQQQQQYMQEMNQVTPSGDPAVTRWADPYLTADFIWWRATQEGLDYAFNGIGDDTVPNNAGKGSMHHPHFSYDPGFKVGFGLKFRHDGWDFFSQYTWLHVNDSKTSVHEKSNSLVYSNLFLPASSNLRSFTAHEAEATWNLHLNALDFELGRNFWISKWLTLRPFAGMKFNWTEQKFNVGFEDVTNNSIPAENGSNIYMKMDQDQWAVGLRAGLDTTWYMAKKWAIYGDFALNGMLNDFDVTRKDRIHRTGGVSFTQANVDRTAHYVTAILEWALGLRFETAFHNDDYMFMMQAGWEEQIWFGQNQFVFFANNNSGGDLSFQGLTVKAGFYF
jgi:Legionella pneumophila major outer membrane protein precursor